MMGSRVTKNRGLAIYYNTFSNTTTSFHVDLL